MADAIILFPELQKLVKLSRVSVWRLEKHKDKQKRFPAHVYLAPGARSVGWRKSEVLKFLEARTRARLRAVVARVI